ncbi:hypothetical protein F4815DRAFT_464814 [Daldinia loculata]|uniref:uncharacterized protein n=1 Tax=Daldinia loculata TaxID=103429 RepID=UPI0020C4019A|nr:uncharacterized protein F4817DRAFT_327434 [Daldinia loculata]KAI1650818.1 hypothetical protein F4817DRAFT_327434 [Daldinia loculata]KAI2781961.1 hypothetical protein F4815DRAFT_464814 [Daldinia loculata]
MDGRRENVPDTISFLHSGETSALFDKLFTTHKTQLNTYSIHFVPVFLEELVLLRPWESFLGRVAISSPGFYWAYGVFHGYWLDEQGQGSGKLYFSLAFWLLTCFTSVMCLLSVPAVGT